MLRVVKRLFALLFGLGLPALYACSTAGLVKPSTTVTPEEDAEPTPIVEEDGAVVLPDGAVVTPVPLTYIDALTVQIMPGDRGQSILDAIRGAKKSIHIEMYLLTNDAMISALRTAKQQGREVQVVLNKDFPTGGNANAQAFTTLQNAGVEVVYAPPAFSFMHAKTMIIDGTSGWIMTMNFTQTSPQDNREYLVRVSEPSEVSELETLFQADFLNLAKDIPGRLVVSPATATSLDAQKRLLALLATATKEIVLEGESMSDTQIVDALVAAHKAGKNVRIILNDQEGSPAQTTAVATVKAAGIPIVKVGTPDIHAKCIVVDRARAYIGSQNFTPTSLLKNREVGVLTQNATEIGKVMATIDADFAKGVPF